MRAPARLAVYGAALVAVFGLSYTVAGAVVAPETVEHWTEQVEETGDDGH